MRIYYLKAKKLILTKKHLIIPFLIVGIMLLFVIFSLGVPESEKMVRSGGCGTDVNNVDNDTAKDSKIAVEGKIVTIFDVNMV